MTSNHDPRNELAVYLGEELRAAREEAGLAGQQLLARELGFHRSVIVKVETGSQPASKAVATLIQQRFPKLCNGLFVVLSAIARKSSGPIPDWYTDFLEREGVATSIRLYQPIIVPGVFQTEDYAREVYARHRPGIGGDELDELVRARLERKGILDKPDAPEIVAILDESVLHRLIGSPKVMHDQIMHLIELSERPNILIQVVPAAIGAHAGLLCAFVIAGLEGEPDLLLTLGIADHTIRDPEEVRKAALDFNLIRGEALPRGQSRDLMRKVDEDKWNV